MAAVAVVVGQPLSFGQDGLRLGPSRAMRVGQPLSFGHAAEGSDRVELYFHVLLLGFCNFLRAKDGY